MNRPWGFFWFNLAALAASQMICSRILPAHPMLGIILAFYSLFILPGIVVWRLVPPGAAINVDGAVRVFLTGLAAACSAVCIGFIPHVSYRLISAVYSLITAAGLIALTARRPRRPRGRVPFPGKERTARSESRLVLAFFALLFAVCSILLYGSVETGVATDAPDHLSFIRRSLDGGGLLPGDSFYEGGDGPGFDQRKGLWHPVAALWARQADLSPEVLWRAIPAMLGSFAILVFWGFAGELVGGVSMKLVALTLLLLVFRGEGAGWLSKLGYSRHVSMVVSWGTAMVMLKYIRGSRRLDLAAAALWAAAGASIHAECALVTGMFILSLAVHTACSAEGRAGMRRFAAAAAAVGAAAAVPVLLRLLQSPQETNLIHRHMQGMLELGGGMRTIDPVELVTRYDLTILFACAVAPFVFFLGRDRARERLVGTLFAVPAMLALAPPTATLLERSLGYFHIRVLNAAPAACLLAVAAAGLGAVAVRPRPPRSGRRADAAARIAAAGALVLLLFALRPAAGRLDGDLRRFVSRSTPRPSAGHRVAAALEGIPEHSVIASDPATSYLVSAFTDHFVVVTLDQHGPPADMTALERMDRTRDLFDPRLPVEASAGWLSSEGVDYVLLDRSGPMHEDFFGVTALLEPDAVLAKLRSRPDCLVEAPAVSGLHLFAVCPAETLRAGPERAAPSPPPCGETAENVPATGLPGPLRLAGFESGTDAVRAGDTVRVRMCWVLDTPVGFGLPFYWTLRFDTPFPRGTFHREWYGKQYRRLVERREGIFYRFTAAGRIASGTALPDSWLAGEPVLQEASIAIPPTLAPGIYTVRICVERRAYIPNRTPADYLRNEDSLWGEAVATLAVTAFAAPAED